MTLVNTLINEITVRNQTWRPLQEVVRDMNQVLRRWSGYFHYRNSTTALSKVKRHAEERLRIHLRKRQKVRDWKTKVNQFPRRVLYEEYGPYKVPTVAGCKSAHALMLRTSESRVRENRLHRLMREGRCGPVLYSTLHACVRNNLTKIRYGWLRPNLDLFNNVHFH